VQVLQRAAAARNTCAPHRALQLQAQGLIAKGFGGASDVYVKLKLGDFQRHVTTVKVTQIACVFALPFHLSQVGSVSPTWNEAFQFDVVSPSASVAVTVWCKRRWVQRAAAGAHCQ
jgi:hypothetical protein